MVVGIVAGMTEIFNQYWRHGAFRIKPPLRTHRAWQERHCGGHCGVIACQKIRESDGGGHCGGHDGDMEPIFGLTWHPVSRRRWVQFQVARREQQAHEADSKKTPCIWCNSIISHLFGELAENVILLSEATVEMKYTLSKYSWDGDFATVDIQNQRHVTIVDIVVLIVQSWWSTNSFHIILSLFHLMCLEGAQVRL